jgi:hypothetical protein
MALMKIATYGKNVSTKVDFHGRRAIAATVRSAAIGIFNMLSVPMKMDQSTLMNRTILVCVPTVCIT